MKLACLDDKTRHGYRLYNAAKTRGWNVGLFNSAEKAMDADYAFMRINQQAPRRNEEKDLARELAESKVTLIPFLRDIIAYEDKQIQFYMYNSWFPPTVIIDDMQNALGYLDTLSYDQYPFISKAFHGSSSLNVRLIPDKDTAIAEVTKAFSLGGLPCAYGPPQKGYVYWQEFCRDNAYDYRVHRVGSEYAIARRPNRRDKPFASGVDNIINVNPNEPECQSVMDHCYKFFHLEDVRYAAIDVVKGNDGYWRILETSLAWSAHKGSFPKRHFLSGRPCSDIWNVILDEIEKGSFDV